MVFIVKSYRLELIKTKIAEPAPPVNSSKDVAKQYRSLEKYDREHLVQLLKEDHEVQTAVLNLIRSCPNIVMKY